MRVAAAAVAAVAVVAALLAGVLPDSAPDSAEVRPTAPTGTPTSPAPTPSRAPGVGVLVDGTLTEADGQTRTIPAAARQMGVTEVTRAGDALLVADGRTFEGTRGLSLVGQGRLTELGPCTTGAAAAASDGRSAWVTFACPESGQPGPTTLTRRSPDGVVSTTVLPYPPDDNMITSAVGLVGHQVLITRGFIGGGFLVDATGTLTPIPGVTSVSAVSPDAGSALASDQGCDPNLVVDVPTGRVRWRGQDLLSFSPDGSRLVGGYGPPVVYAARSGRPLATVAPPDGVRLVGGPVWEDDRHLLAVAKDDAGRSVVRLGLDGSVERAGAPLPDRVQILLVP